MELVDVNTGVDYSKVDVSGKAVLIKSESFIPDDYKIQLAAQHGARLAIFYWPQSFSPTGNQTDVKPVPSHNPKSNQEPAYKGTTSDPAIVAVDIDGHKANDLKSRLVAGSVRLKLEAGKKQELIAPFSSRGPNSNFHLKPDLVAPGVEILSTVPKKGISGDPSGYRRINGTSMAAPHVAGSAALLRQLHPDWNPRQIKGALTGTARGLDFFDPLTQGSGQLDVAAAASTTIMAQPSSLSLGLADVEKSTSTTQKTFEITNKGNEPVDLQLQVQRFEGEAVETSISPSSAVISPGESKRFKLTMILNNTKIDQDITGWVIAKAKDDKQPDLRIPYYLSVRHLFVYTSPDPVYGEADVFIHAPLSLTKAPQVTITGPDGAVQTRTASLDHGLWWRAPLKGDKLGIHHVQVKAFTSEGSVLTGSTVSEVLEPDKITPAASAWQPVGPNSIGLPMVFDNNNHKRVIAYRNGGTLFLSENAGETWKQLNTLPVASGSPAGLAFDPQNSKRIYLAMNGSYLDNTYAGRLFVSDNLGRTWTTLPFPNVALTSLTMDEKNNRLFVATSDTVYLSTDSGRSWKETAKIAGIQDTTVLDGKLYVAAEQGLFIIRDPAGEGTPEKLLAESADQVTGDAKVLFTGTRNGLFASRDGGATWEMVFKPTGFFSGFTFIRLVDNTVYAGAGLRIRIWAGTDYGQKWNELPQPNPDTVSIDVGSWSSGKKSPLYVASRGAGIFTTRDMGKTYQRIGVPVVDVYSLAIGKDKAGKEVLLAGTTFETYRTAVPTREAVDANTSEWGFSGREGGVGTETFFVAASPGNPRVVYKVNNGLPSHFTVSRSEDGGKTWVQQTRGQEAATAFMIHPADPDRIMIGYTSLVGSGLLISEDGGENWREQNLGLEPLALAGDSNDTNRIWMGTASGLHLSEDGGKTFKQIQEMPVTSLAISPKDTDHLIIGGYQIFVSKDGGRTLQKGAYGDLNLYVSDLLVSPQNPNLVFAATTDHYRSGLFQGGRGVLYSRDGGETWHSFSRGLQNMNTSSLLITPDGKHLYVGTYGGGVHRIKLNQGKKP